jgi:hypothetical protein
MKKETRVGMDVIDYVPKSSTGTLKEVIENLKGLGKCVWIAVLYTFAFIGLMTVLQSIVAMR